MLFPAVTKMGSLSVRPNAVGLLEVHSNELAKLAGAVNEAMQLTDLARHSTGTGSSWTFSDDLDGHLGKLCLKMFKGSLVRKLPYGRMSRGSLVIIMSTT